MGGVVKSIGGIVGGPSGVGGVAQAAGSLLNVGSPVGAVTQVLGNISAGVGTQIGGAIKANGGLGALAGKAAGYAQGVAQGGMGALGPSPMKGNLGGIGAALEQLGPGKLVDPKIGALVGQAGDLGPALHKVLVGSVLRQDAGSAFCGLLLATVKRVNEKTNFNLEVEINDLLVKLGNLRDPHLASVGPSPSSKAVSAKVSEAMEALSQIGSAVGSSSSH